MKYYKLKGASPLINEPGTCGWNLAITFILSPTFQPDLSCLNKINQIDFSGKTEQTKQVAIQYFGTDDIWGLNKSNETVRNSASSFYIFSFDYFPLILIIFYSNKLI